MISDEVVPAHEYTELDDLRPNTGADGCDYQARIFGDMQRPPGVTSE